MPDDDTDLLPIAHAAKLLGVTPATLRRWERDGYVTPLRTPGGQRRYRRNDLGALLEHMTPTNPGEVTPSGSPAASPTRAATG